MLYENPGDLGLIWYWTRGSRSASPSWLAPAGPSSFRRLDLAELCIRDKVARHRPDLVSLLVALDSADDQSQLLLALQMLEASTIRGAPDAESMLRVLACVLRPG